jgi:hypothetical protein
MSFREKSAWVSLVSFAAVLVLFAWNAALVLGGRRSWPPGLELLLLAVVIVVSAGLQIAIAIRSPAEARTPKDERERLIALKSTRPAFFVLLVSALLSVGTVHLPLHGLHLKVMMIAIMLSIALAGIVKFATEVLLYRRDA